MLFSSDPEIEELVARIPVFQEKERDEKMLSFYSDLYMSYDYFWKACRPEGYMKIRTASEIVYCIYRLILQENRVLFPVSYTHLFMTRRWISSSMKKNMERHS